MNGDGLNGDGLNGDGLNGDGLIIRIDVTPRAARRVRTLLADRADDVDRTGLRVAPHPEQAARYLLSLAPAPEPQEIVLPRNGFDVFADRRHAQLLDGVRIDYLESEAGAGFTVDRIPAPRRAPSLPAPSESDAALEPRVREAIESVRPVLIGDGGDVELVAVADGVAYVRLEGACSGCSAALSTLTHLVEASVAAAVPEVGRTVLVA